MASNELTYLWLKYKKFVLNNPELTGELETFVKWITYFISSQSSRVLSELIYCASNLVILLNDTILEELCNSISVLPALPEEKIRKYLAALGYVEVFAEISSYKAWGKTGKWIVISIIEILKLTWKLILLLRYKSGLIKTVTLPSPNRKRIIEVLKKNSSSTVASTNDGGYSCTSSSTPGSMTFTLNSSGRTIRTLAAAPSVSCRIWKVPDSFNSSSLNYYHSSPLNKVQLVAEVVYAFRPIAHLILMRLFGEKSWKPWLISCCMDTASVQLMDGTQPRNTFEHAEIARRRILLLFYLLRSPFYDNYLKAKILHLLNCLQKNASIGAVLWDPLIEYAQTWDKTYFYSWDP